MFFVLMIFVLHFQLTLFLFLFFSLFRMKFPRSFIDPIVRPFLFFFYPPQTSLVFSFRSLRNLLHNVMMLCRWEHTLVMTKRNVGRLRSHMRIPFPHYGLFLGVNIFFPTDLISLRHLILLHIPLGHSFLPPFHSPRLFISLLFCLFSFVFVTYINLQTDRQTHRLRPHTHIHALNFSITYPASRYKHYLTLSITWPLMRVF